MHYFPPVGTQVFVDADVYVVAGQNANIIESNVIAAINDLFDINQQIMGKYIVLSDIEKAIVDVAGVDYTVLHSPLYDYVAYPYSFPILQNITLNIMLSERTLIARVPYTFMLNQTPLR